MTRKLTVAVFAVLMLAIPLTAVAGGYHDKETTTTTAYEETTTTIAEETTTTAVEETTTTVEETTTTTDEVTTTMAPEGFCVDPNTASVPELMQVQGVDRDIAWAIVNTTTFDSPFSSIGELQSVMGLGNQVLEPVFPDWPGYFADECLSAGIRPTTTTANVEATLTIPDPPTTTTPSPVEELPFTGPPSEWLVIVGAFALASGGMAVWRTRQED